mgnify:CR=1 FL=1
MNISKEIEKIINGDSYDPFKVLGIHPVLREGKRIIIIRAYHPWAKEGYIIKDLKKYKMEKIKEGFFEIEFKEEKKIFDYKVFIVPHYGNAFEYDDPYRFLPVISDYDKHLYNEGNHFKIYEKLGAHLIEHQGVKGCHFAVWAPNARRISVISDFNAWDGRIHQMRVLGSSGIWEIFIPNVTEGEKYKFEIKTKEGHLLIKSDPFAFYTELRPKTASIVYSLENFNWDDEEYISQRAKKNPIREPISIYEVHLGSFKRVVEENNRFITYKEAAKDLISYVKDMGFTHIEFLPMAEHSLDESWGYQVTGYFSPTSRYGKPKDLMEFINEAHKNGIGVIIDWVPGHFPTDGHGLSGFDGTALYEHQDPKKGYHPDWKTSIFNFGRNEVQSFLFSNALYWFEKYHIDGLRVDAVASMLYLDYSRKEGEWIPNIYGGRENLEAISFLKKINEIAHQKFPGIMMIAEESTAFPMVSKPTYLGGLGFTFKWNMGWMHDTLRYFSKDPIFRKYHHNDLTFSLLYAFSENFILPLSHDEVVHGKGSLIQKMPGDWWQKFANLRLLFLYLFTHPGKKLLFMGQEIGQFDEWSEKKSIDWHLIDFSTHKGIQKLVIDLNKIYKNERSLWVNDTSFDGFQWICHQDIENSVISFLRKDDRGEFLVVILNFTPVVRENYRIGVPAYGFYKEILNTDSSIYYGTNVGNLGGVWAENIPWHLYPYSISLKLPPLGGIIMKIGT